MNKNQQKLSQKNENPFRKAFIWIEFGIMCLITLAFISSIIIPNMSEWTVILGIATAVANALFLFLISQEKK
jgi:membrane protein YqaA with SNARE-associated domain